MIARGANLTVVRMPGGEALSAGPRGRWRHPWFVTPEWAGEEWVCTVKPGTVNGVAPAHRTYREVQKKRGWFEQRLNGPNPLTGRKYFTAHVFKQEEVGSAGLGEPLDVPLYLSPKIELQFRPIGLDGAPEEIVPPYFLDLGVEQVETLQNEGQPLDELVEEAVEKLSSGRKPGARLLRAADLILHQPRSGLQVEITIQPDFNGISNVTQRLTVDTPDAGDALRVFSGRYLPPQPIDPLAGVYSEPNYDELLLATVFLLSPPDAAPDSDADGTWLPFVKHNLFWPLTYQGPPPFRPRELSSGALSVPLLGGLAQPIVNFFTAAAGDAADMALNWMQGQSNKGRWWTATGGGSDAEFPAEPVAAPVVRGFDRAARIAAEAAHRGAQQAATRRRQALDPRFPFRAVPYHA